MACATPQHKAPPPPAPPPPLSEPAATPQPPPAPAPPAPAPVGGTIVDERVYGGDAGVNGGALAIDARGNRFVVGSFRGVATFGDLPPLPSEQEDAYFLKLDP